MVRLGMVLLAFVVAVATTIVPARTVMKPLHHGAAAQIALAAAEAPSDAQNAPVPMKRCQSGAGLLGCPFEEPASIAVERRTAAATIRFDMHVGTLTGRSVPAVLRPPRALSA